MTSNEAMREQWNQGEAMHWVEQADRYDRQLQPFAELIVAASELDATHRVLDVGCGCGATTIAAAQPAQHAVGADISEPMLDVARQRAQDIDNCEFVLADVQNADLGEAVFDRIISRFGVMFFDDPDVAFARMRTSLRPGGRLTFVCWQPLVANDWLLVPGIAAAAHVDLPDDGEPGPGMFSLHDREHILTLLTNAGFAEVEVESARPTILLGGEGSVDDALEFLLGTGIARSLLEPADPPTRARAIDAVRAALETHYEPGAGVRLGTGAWLVNAQA